MYLAFKSVPRTEFDEWTGFPRQYTKDVPVAIGATSGEEGEGDTEQQATSLEVPPDQPGAPSDAGVVPTAVPYIHNGSTGSVPPN